MDAVRNALTKIATAGEAKLVEKDDPAAVLKSKKGADKKTIDFLLDPSRTLITVRKEGKAEFARLTTTGFLEALPALPADQQGELAERFAAALPVGERVGFLLDVAGRTTGESAALLLRVVDALRAESEAQAAVAEKRRAAEAEVFRRMLDWKRAEGDRLERELSDARSAVERLGSLVGETPRPPKPPEKATGTAPQPPLAPPVTPEDFDFRRQAARRLVSSWLEAVRMGKTEGRQFLETAIGNMTAIRQIGEVGEEVLFDGVYHRCARPVRDGESVRVVRPGWVLDDENGDNLLAPAEVE